MPAKRWLELTTQEFEKLDCDHTIVVLPIGATEQHGPHLPVGVDTYCVEALQRRVEEMLDEIDVISMPTLWCTKSNEHHDFSGTVFLRQETLASVIEDISSCVARMGFKRLVLLNWHGGNNDLLACLIRDIHHELGLLTYVINGGGLLSLDESKPKLDSDKTYDIHAGRFETSVMLAEYPELVRSIDFNGIGSDFAHGKMAKLFANYKYLIPEGGPINMGWVISDLTDDGVVGDPHGANAEDGNSFMEFISKILCELLREISRFDFETRA